MSKRKLVDGIVSCKHPLFPTWCNIRSRCKDKKNKYYGGKGIEVCKRWNSFELFVFDMGPKPTKEYSIDRINGDKNYEPNNCKWSTMKEQGDNQKSRCDNTSGYKGVTRTPSGKWKSIVTENQRKVYLGVFDTPEEASMAYKAYKG